MEAIRPIRLKAHQQSAMCAKHVTSLRANGNRGWDHQSATTSQAASQTGQDVNTGQQTSALMIGSHAGLELTPVYQTGGIVNEFDSQPDRRDRVETRFNLRP